VNGKKGVTLRKYSFNFVYPFAFVGVGKVFPAMDVIKSSKERLAEGLRLERSGELEAAAALYRKVTEHDPINPEAVARLLVLYRKQKNFREELAVIDRALAGYAERDKARQAQWVRTHSKAAAAGTAVFRKLGGASVSGFGADPVVVALIRRKGNVERKVSGKKGVKRVTKSSEGLAPGKRKAREKGGTKNPMIAAPRKKKEERAKHSRAAQQKKEERRKKETDARIAAAEKAAAKKAEKEAKKAEIEAVKKAAREEKGSSLFVITLTYRVPLQEIDAAMAEHIAFLDKHYEKGDFLVSGRQVPRTGGIILAKGRDLRQVERMMQADPFIKRRLAELEVVEFKASRVGKELARYFSKAK
jgi:uncharacterized protein YciI